MNRKKPQFMNLKSDVADTQRNNDFVSSRSNINNQENESNSELIGHTIPIRNEVSYVDDDGDNSEDAGDFGAMASSKIRTPSAEKLINLQLVPGQPFKGKILATESSLPATSGQKRTGGATDEGNSGNQSLRKAVADKLENQSAMLQRLSDENVHIVENSMRHLDGGKQPNGENGGDVVAIYQEIGMKQPKMFDERLSSSGMTAVPPSRSELKTH